MENRIIMLSLDLQLYIYAEMIFFFQNENTSDGIDLDQNKITKIEENKSGTQGLQYLHLRAFQNYRTPIGRDASNWSNSNLVQSVSKFSRSIRDSIHIILHPHAQLSWL